MKRLSILMAAAGASLLAASALGSVSQVPPPNTFRWSLTVDIDNVDPALAYYDSSWALQYATGAMLFNYPDSAAPRGARLVPEVAAGFPSISKDGRTYTFRLKRTYRFSNGRPVTAWNFAWAIRRSIDRRMSGWREPPPGARFLLDVVGVRDVVDRRGDPPVPGVRVLDRYRLQIRLTRPSATSSRG
jgi:oligopeptide transport system substrate-binding protein